MPSLLLFKNRNENRVLEDSTSLYYRKHSVINIHIPTTKEFMNDCIDRIKRINSGSNTLISLDNPSLENFRKIVEEYEKTKKPPAKITEEQMKTMVKLFDEIAEANTYKRDGGWMSRNCTIM